MRCSRKSLNSLRSLVEVHPNSCGFLPAGIEIKDPVSGSIFIRIMDYPENSAETTRIYKESNGLANFYLSRFKKQERFRES